MHYLCSIYFANQSPHALSVFVAHHQEVFIVYVQQLLRFVHFCDWQLTGSGWNEFHPDPASCKSN
jgi:hypothetical protein